MCRSAAAIPGEHSPLAVQLQRNRSSPHLQALGILAAAGGEVGNGRGEDVPLSTERKRGREFLPFSGYRPWAASPAGWPACLGGVEGRLGGGVQPHLQHQLLPLHSLCISSNCQLKILITWQHSKKLGK